eukprot:scaffold1809_cov386-Prasinococcus_capsulatus_cf.AAC.15
MPAYRASHAYWSSLTIHQTNLKWATQVRHKVKACASLLRSAQLLTGGLIGNVLVNMFGPIMEPASPGSCLRTSALTKRPLALGLTSHSGRLARTQQGKSYTL